MNDEKTDDSNKPAVNTNESKQPETKDVAPKKPTKKLGSAFANVVFAVNVLFIIPLVYMIIKALYLLMRDNKIDTSWDVGGRGMGNATGIGIMGAFVFAGLVTWCIPIIIANIVCISELKKGNVLNARAFMRTKSSFFVLIICVIFFFIILK